MRVRLYALPDALVRTAITIREAQRLLAQRCQSEAEWRSLTADEQIFRSYRARQLLSLSLVNDELAAYIWSPLAGWHRVPRDFWLLAGMTVQDIVERAVLDDEYGAGDRFLDAPEDIDGQPFVVWSEEVARFAQAGEWVRLADLTGLHPARVSVPTDNSLGTLPPNASGADRRDEPFAHEAAKLVRRGMVLAEAIRTVAPSDGNREPSSIERVIRTTFDKMYDKRGEPLIKK